MSKWSETKDYLIEKGIVSKFGIKKMPAENLGYKLGTESLTFRKVKLADGTIEQRPTIVPRHRSKYSPKTGESVGPAKPGRNTGRKE